MKTTEFIGTLETGEIGEYFADYDSGYICDIITEIADNQISIWTQDQINFAMNEDEWVDQAIWSGLAQSGREYFDNNRNASFRDYVAHVGIAAWYEKNTSDLYEHLAENVRLAICTALRKNGIEEMTGEQIEEIEDLDIDQDDRLEDVIERALEIFEESEDEDDE